MTSEAGPSTKYNPPAPAPAVPVPYSYSWQAGSRQARIVVAVSVVESFCVAAVVVWLFGKVENVR